MSNSLKTAAVVAWCAVAGLAGCYGSTSNPPSATPTSIPLGTPTPTASPTSTPTVVPSGPTPTPTAQPQVVHIGFELNGHRDPTYGFVYFYSLTPGNQANVVRVKAGSQLVFLNDGPEKTQHTASGLGTKFPPRFDNTSGFNQNGTTIDASLTWSSGTLNPGQLSQVFTVGRPGAYFFGCNYHYQGVPSASNPSMGDVIVSM